jgi:hypothetical protein
MKTKAALFILSILLSIQPLSSARAQEVSIPDAGLAAAIRDALQKPSGALTEQDLLSLTNLPARARGITSLAGLEAAANLTILDLRTNNLSALIVPNGLTRLVTIDLSLNPLANCTIPEGLTNLQRILMEAAALTTWQEMCGNGRWTGLEICRAARSSIQPARRPVPLD